VLGGNVGEQHGAGNHYTGQAAATEEIAILCVKVLISQFPPGVGSDKSGKGDESQEGQHGV
jgi:hypothetical protein